MKKCCLILTALILALSLCAGAAAETAVRTDAYKWYDAELCRNSNVMIVRAARGDAYTLVDAAGLVLTNEPYVYMRERDSLIQVAVDHEAVNCYGVIDAAGRMVVPMQYGDINFLSDRWVIGVELESATEENYDYSTFGSEKKFYLVSKYDVYYCGTLVGTLGRTDYKSASAYGAYLVVRNRAGSYAGYDSAFTPSTYEITSSGEYDDDYRSKTIYHVASGMPAFTEGCTLTPADVERSVFYKDGQLLDLQGNVAAELDVDTVYSFYGDYAYVRKDKTYGMIDKTGKLVIPCEMDDQIYANEVYFGSGYQLVSKDGKLCWATPAEGIVYTTGINSSVSYRLNGAFAHVEDENGARIVVTPLGQLPEHYSEVDSSSSSAACILAVQNAEGTAGVIGMAGEEVVPMDGAYTRLYDLTVSKDGTLVLGDKGRGKDGLHEYVLYTVAYDPTGLSVAPVDDGSWICPECQTSNSGKFCSECGAKKPE